MAQGLQVKCPGVPGYGGCEFFAGGAVRHDSLVADGASPTELAPVVAAYG